jgi:GDPmannose 4,6-dehydratase
VDLLLADPSKAHRTLGWHPQMTFERLVTTMVDADVAALSAGVPRRRAA